MTPVVFDGDAVRSALTMADCIDLMADIQAAISRGEISLPLRSALTLDDPANHLLVMPGAITNPPVFGAKLLSLFPGNRSDSDSGLPTVQGCVLLFNGSNGEPLALIEAASLTEIRTAAASGAATRALANPDAACLALLGYGVQARSHLEAMRSVRPVKTVTVWGPDADRTRAFADRYAADPGISVAAVETPEEAVREADLICAVSAAQTPIIQGGWLKPGCHLNLVGAATANAREADGNTLQRARVFTEVTDFALSEAGDILLAIGEGLITVDQIAGEIGAVINGEITGRQHREQITLYKSLGNTAQDLVAAHRVYDSSRRR